MIERYTTAPEAYDGFGTTTIRSTAYQNGNGYREFHTFRLVDIDPRHLLWQEARYGSGMHVSLSSTEFWRQVDAGLLERRELTR